MKKFINAFRNALNGFIIALKTQRNFKIQLFIGFIACIAGFCFKINNTEWTIIVLSILLVLGFELINTSIEKLCDFVNPEFNSTVKVIKDLSAGAVLLVSTGALLTGLVIFLPKIFIVFKF